MYHSTRRDFVWRAVGGDFDGFWGSSQCTEERCCYESLGVLSFPEGYHHEVGVRINLVCKEVAGAAPMVHTACPEQLIC